MSDGQLTFEAVQLLRIPVPIWAQTQEHTDELLREFTLMAARLRELPDSRDVPVRLVELIEELTEQYGGLNTDQENRLAEAAEAGVAEIDLTYRVPRQAAEAANRLQEILSESDAYCRAGRHLLTLATPPELLRFRNWFLEEFACQLNGAAPTPYPSYQG
ncbi:MAG: hypothetical protein M3083_00295 [Actinomycetota bacterium]|nr:hypothetical protein [Actinomycetota bacterium]